MTQLTAIVVVIDRWGSGFMGPYGNTWLDTPHMNRLASESFLFENLIADTSHLEVVYRSYWLGRHALAAEESTAAGIAAMLHEIHVPSLLITDDERIAGHPLAAGFSEQIVVPRQTATRAAAEIGDTQLARLFAETIVQLEQNSAPQLVWIHASAMNSAWDAPLEFRRKLADEEDPDPPDFVEPPNLLLKENFDPDELLGITHAYAGQVAALDIVLGAFRDAIESTTLAKRAMLMLTSPRGYPLGEHCRVGPMDQALYSELTACPLLIRLPDRTGQCGRSRALVQPPDLFATLVDWFGLNDIAPSLFARSLLPIVREERDSLRSFACSASDSRFALRTPAWSMLADDSNEELFVKPDDRWEVNDVADRCRDVVAEMRDLWQSLKRKPANLPEPLSDILLNGPM